LLSANLLFTSSVLLIFNIGGREGKGGAELFVAFILNKFVTVFGSLGWT
jgi:hypothetical protein